MKKIYNCKHQKEAASPCSICKEARGNYSGGWEKGYRCGKCGKLIKEGVIRGWKDGKLDKEYDEEWAEVHDNCQSNSKEQKEIERKREEVEKKRKEVEEAREKERNKPHNPDSPLPSISKSELKDKIVYGIACKFCGQYWRHETPKDEDSKKRAEEWLVKAYQMHQKEFANSTAERERERERERRPRRGFSWQRQMLFLWQKSKANNRRKSLLFRRDKNEKRRRRRKNFLLFRMPG